MRKVSPLTRTLACLLAFALAHFACGPQAWALVLPVRAVSAPVGGNAAAVANGSSLVNSASPMLLLPQSGLAGGLSAPAITPSPLPSSIPSAVAPVAAPAIGASQAVASQDRSLAPITSGANSAIKSAPLTERAASKAANIVSEVTRFFGGKSAETPPVAPGMIAAGKPSATHGPNLAPAAAGLSSLQPPTRPTLPSSESRTQKGGALIDFVFSAAVCALFGWGAYGAWGMVAHPSLPAHIPGLASSLRMGEHWLVFSSAWGLLNAIGVVVCLKLYCALGPSWEESWKTGEAPALRLKDLLTVFPLMALIEELIFRLGMMWLGAHLLFRLTPLGMEGSMLTSMVVSSAIFAWVHEYGPKLPRFIASMLFSYLLLTQGLWVAAGAHYFSNAIIVILSRFPRWVNETKTK